jgi:ADP-ribose pyrophosphatase YjhB (NUDIX family)
MPDLPHVPDLPPMPDPRWAGRTDDERPLPTGAVERPLTDEEHAMLASQGRGPDGRSTDIASGLGPPHWLLRQFNFCQNCGTGLVLAVPPAEVRERLGCPSCGYIAYVNPKLVVTALPVNDRGECVLLRRGIEPGYGAWAQPGGFLEVDETLAEGAVREVLEETGLLVEPGQIVGLYSRLEATVVTLVYEARIVGGEAIVTPEALEVRAFGPSEIPWDEIAFTTTFYGLRDWVERRHPGTAVPHVYRGREAG